MANKASGIDPCINPKQKGVNAYKIDMISLVAFSLLVLDMGCGEVNCKVVFNSLAFTHSTHHKVTLCDPVCVHISLQAPQLLRPSLFSTLVHRHEGFLHLLSLLPLSSFLTPLAIPEVNRTKTPPWRITTRRPTWSTSTKGKYNCRKSENTRNSR